MIVESDSLAKPNLIVCWKDARSANEGDTQENKIQSKI
jgi:hypothetical protein